MVEEKKKPLELGRSGLLRVTPPRPVTPLSRRAAADDQTSLVTEHFHLAAFQRFQSIHFEGTQLHEIGNIKENLIAIEKMGRGEKIRVREERREGDQRR